MKIFKFLLPIVVLALAGALAVALVKTRPKAQKKPQQERAQLVETKPVTLSTEHLQVSARGNVVVARQLEVQPQVAGQLTYVNPELVVGGLLKSGDILAKVDRRDYQLTLDERQASVLEAQARYDVERGQQAIAKKEWELFNKNRDAEQDSGLATRKPQLQIAQVAVDSAKTRVDRAKLDLNRTTLRAPFNAIVRSESVEEGQLVTTQSRVATIVSTEQFWVQVALPLKNLADIQIPGYNAQAGSEVTIVQELGAQRLERKGKVIRILGELDAVGRMAQVIVEVEDPLNLKAENKERGLPLLLGSFVEVIFDAGERESLVEVPRVAVHDGDTVFILEQDRLKKRKVEIAWRRPDTVLIRSGLAPGELLITSRVPNPIDGMKLRVEGAAPASEQAPKEPAKPAEKPSASPQGGKP